MFVSTLVSRPLRALAALALFATALGAAPSPPHRGANRPASSRQPAAKPSPAAHPRSPNAPADEYFGRQGMSILGVRNKVKDLGLEADIHPDRAPAILNNAVWVEDAMRAWARKYPFDRWLPRYAYALEQMYEHIPGDAAHRRATKQVAYLTAYFPQTQYGRVGRAKLAQGIPTPDPAATPEIATELDRLALLDGKIVPTLPPAPSASIAPSPASAPTPAAAPTPTPTPVSSPAATAAPSAIPAVRPARP